MHAVLRALLRAWQGPRTPARLQAPVSSPPAIRRTPQSTRVFCSKGDNKHSNKPVGVLSLRQGHNQELVVPLVFLGLNEQSKAFRAVSLLSWADVVSDAQWKTWYRPLGHEPWHHVQEDDDKPSSSADASASTTVCASSSSRVGHTGDIDDHHLPTSTHATGAQLRPAGLGGSEGSRGQDIEQDALQLGADGQWEMVVLYGGQGDDGTDQDVSVAIAVHSDGDGVESDDHLFSDEDEAGESWEVSLSTCRQAVKLGQAFSTPPERGSLVFGYWSKCPYG